MSVERGGGLDIAVVGSGISGTSCAWLLSQRHNVTLFEAAPRLGGHTNTVMVATADGPLPVDTGFIVFNAATYPNFVALLAHLGVATQPSDMSFSVSLDDGALEYAGTDLAGLLAQPRNLVRPRFWSMLHDLLRFYREAPGRLAEIETLTLGDFLDREGYGAAFREDHLLPMAAAIWSAPRDTLLAFPAASFVRFCDNHGLLKVTDRPIWRTVTGGSQRYLAPLTRPYAASVRRECPVTSVVRDGRGVAVHDTSGAARRYDHCVLATHADQALALLAAPSAAETKELGAFVYSRNRAVLHTDAALMPRRHKAWSSWNYLGSRSNADTLRVTYWMNKLQTLDTNANFFVTLNPAREPTGVIHEDIYDHPVFDLAALDAQKRLWSLQGQGGVWFCGAHFGAGFHEDGLQAGLAVAEAIGGVRRPWDVANESSRIHLSDAPAAARIAA